MNRVFAFAWLLSLAVAAGAQEPAVARPDLSGTWRMDEAASKLQTPAPDSSVFRIEHREPRFKLARTHVFAGKPETLTIELTTDGKEAVTEEPGETSYDRCRWEGDRLVYESRIVRGKREAKNVVAYSLSADGQTLTAEERFAGPVLKYENLWVFQRK